MSILSLFRKRSGIGPSTPLDDLVRELAESGSLERKKILWAEVVRRFVHDVETACEVAGIPDPEKKAGTILDQALREIGPGRETQYFSRELIRIMTAHLGSEPVLKVQRSVYLRQFLYLAPEDDIRYAEGLLNYRGNKEWLAKAVSESPDSVRAGCKRAFRGLAKNLGEFTDEEIRDRTDSVWTLLKLKDQDNDETQAR